MHSKKRSCHLKTFMRIDARILEEESRYLINSLSSIMDSGAMESPIIELHLATEKWSSHKTRPVLWHNYVV
jgi:hypothetical protein